MQSIDSKETFAYRTSQGLVSRKEEIKYDNIIKRHKKWLTLMMLQKKTWKNIIQIGLEVLDHS